MQLSTRIGRGSFHCLQNNPSARYIITYNLHTIKIICLWFLFSIHILIMTETPREPCSPSPCGPNSICKVVNSVAVCSCQPGQIGSPPACRPECIVSAECPLTEACLNNKCVDPCPGTCGQSARCQVVNHNPICSCAQGNTGDPFSRCYPIPGNIISFIDNIFVSFLVRSTIYLISYYFF